MNYKSSSPYPWVGPWDAEGGGAKSVAEALSEAGHTIATAYDLYTHLKQHHSSPTNSYHESLHQIDFREFHFFPRGTFLNYHPRQPKALDGVRPFYCWAVKRNNNDDAKIIYKRKHFCPCPNCTEGAFHQCYHANFLGEWFMEEMTIRSRSEDPIADKRADHAHSIKLRIQELLASHGIFFVAIYTNDETQRLTFAQVSKAKSRLYDIRIRVHVYPPHVPEGELPSNYYNYARFVVPTDVCYQLHCNCERLHTQLVEYSKILLVCMSTTKTGNLISTLDVEKNLSTTTFAVLQFKDTYKDEQLEKYKTLRMQLWAPYRI